jgi:hypothetical protein
MLLHIVRIRNIFLFGVIVCYTSYYNRGKVYVLRFIHSKVVYAIVIRNLIHVCIVSQGTASMLCKILYVNSM